MEHISGSINTVVRYPVHSGKTMQTASQENTNRQRLQKLPPTVKPEKNPDQIIREILPSETDRKALANFLIQYHKSKEAQWDDFRKKIAGGLLASLTEILAEMRRNGFFGLGARNTQSGMLQFTWYQATDNRIKAPIVPATLCDACERSCARKDRENFINDSRRNGIVLKGKMAEELPPCWKE